MRIGIDLDDVICDFIGTFVKLANETFGKPEIGTLPIDWEWSNLGLSKEEIDQLWAIIRSTPRFWLDLGKEDGFSAALLRDLDMEHELFFITARMPTGGDSVKYQSARWLAKYGVCYPTVLVEHNKSPLAAALKLEAFVDDRPKNILEIQAALPNCKMYLKDSSHNQGVVIEGVQRVQDFNEFAKIILGGS